MKHLINILKGACIGIANVIPGFSGGTMAVMLKIYDLFVYAFANVFTHFKDVFKKCWSLFLGIAIGVVFALFTIVKLLEVIPFITIMFFVGLIFGSMPSIYKSSKEGNLKIADIISFIVAIAIIVILPFISKEGNSEVSYSVGIYFLMLFLGIICSSAMVIPGVSGSLVLMAFGYYAFLMETIKTFLKNIFNFSMANYFNMVFVIVSFAIGCIIGLVFVSKLIIKLTEKYPKTVYVTILGLLVASPFSIIYKTMTNYTVTFNALVIVFSIISFAIGVFLVLFGDYMANKVSSKANCDTIKESKEE